MHLLEKLELNICESHLKVFLIIFRDSMLWSVRIVTEVGGKEDPPVRMPEFLTMLAVAALVLYSHYKMVSYFVGSSLQLWWVLWWNLLRILMHMLNHFERKCNTSTDS